MVNKLVENRDFHYKALGLSREEFIKSAKEDFRKIAGSFAKHIKQDKLSLQQESARLQDKYIESDKEKLRNLEKSFAKHIKRDKLSLQQESARLQDNTRLQDDIRKIRNIRSGRSILRLWAYAILISDSSSVFIMHFRDLNCEALMELVFAINASYLLLTNDPDNLLTSAGTYITKKDFDFVNKLYASCIHNQEHSQNMQIGRNLYEILCDFDQSQQAEILNRALFCLLNHQPQLFDEAQQSAIRERKTAHEEQMQEIWATRQKNYWEMLGFDAIVAMGHYPKHSRVAKKIIRKINDVRLRKDERQNYIEIGEILYVHLYACVYTAIITKFGPDVRKQFIQAKPDTLKSLTYAMYAFCELWNKSYNNPNAIEDTNSKMLSTIQAMQGSPKNVKACVKSSLIHNILNDTLRREAMFNGACIYMYYHEANKLSTEQKRLIKNRTAFHHCIYKPTQYKNHYDRMKSITCLNDTSELHRETATHHNHTQYAMLLLLTKLKADAKANADYPKITVQHNIENYRIIEDEAKQYQNAVDITSDPEMKALYDLTLRCSNQDIQERFRHANIRELHRLRSFISQVNLAAQHLGIGEDYPHNTQNRNAIITFFTYMNQKECDALLPLALYKMDHHVSNTKSALPNPQSLQIAKQDASINKETCNKAEQAQQLTSQCAETDTGQLLHNAQSQRLVVGIETKEDCCSRMTLKSRLDDTSEVTPYRESTKHTMQSRLCRNLDKK